MKLHIYSLFYGVKFGGFWERFAMHSLGWPKNLSALRAHETTIHAYTDDEPRAKRVAKRLGLPLVTHRPNTPTKTIRVAMHEAATEGATLLFAAPDMVFGDGSVKGMLEVLSIGANRAVAAAHPRVDEIDFAKKWTGEPLNNPDLVGLAMSSLHRAVAAAFIPAKSSTSHHCGISIKSVDRGLFAVTAHIPSIHMIAPTEKDAEDLGKFGDGAWDHTFPALLVDQHRLRIIGTSDAVFCVELTDPKGRPGAYNDVNPLEMDSYKSCMPHNIASSTCVGFWRANVKETRLTTRGVSIPGPKSVGVREQWHQDRGSHENHQYGGACDFAERTLGKGEGRKCLVVGSPIFEVEMLGQNGWEVTWIDVREPKRKPKRFIKMDALDLDRLEAESFDALSSTCLLTHVGTGRYGDRFQPDGDLVALR